MVAGTPPPLWFSQVCKGRHQEDGGTTFSQTEGGEGGGGGSSFRPSFWPFPPSSIL
jgi:hypothetical protein